MSLSDFKILTKLGSGAYSSVYKVERMLDHEIYALKKVGLTGLSHKQKLNALNQVRILASIRHPNIIGYREAFLDDETCSLCIIMEFASQGDLYRKIVEKAQKKQFFTEDQVWEVFISITRGLKCLHDRKVMHRDLKSANVFLMADGKAKLGDLNVSKFSQKSLGETQTGTPYYASPEVWKDLAYGPKSDIWSLGCVIYEMMALRPPFQAEDMEGLYTKVTRADYPRLPLRYSSDLNALVRILLQADQYKRPSCDKILSMKIVAKRISDHVRQTQKENSELLETIKLPKDIYLLTQHLPRPNYLNPEAEKNSESKLKPIKTDKIRKKGDNEPKAQFLLPRLNRKDINKKEFNSNKSLSLKQPYVVEAARNEVKDNNTKDFILKNKNVQEMKAIREKKIKREKDTSIQVDLNRQRKTIDVQSKISSIQKIYHDNLGVKKMK